MVFGMIFLMRVFCLIGFFGLFCQEAFCGPVVSPKAYVLTNAFDWLPITNSMVTSWAISIVIIFLFRFVLNRKFSIIPSRTQGVLEVILENVRGTIEPIVGKKLTNKVFPFLLMFFLYILIQNWSGLFPGVGSFGNYDSHGHFLYFFRPSNTDLNSTLSLALASFAIWLFFIFKYSGPTEIYKHIFGNKANKKEVPFLVYVSFFAIFFIVGLIECVSIGFRLVSLSFRLFGNVFGGENLLVSIYNIHKLIPNEILSVIYRMFVPVPFYFLEALIGFIQAFVFTLLIAVYIGLICNHEEEPGTEH